MDDMTTGVLIGMAAALMIVGATALVLVHLAERLLIGPQKAPRAPKEVSGAGYTRGGTASNAGLLMTAVMGDTPPSPDGPWTHTFTPNYEPEPDDEPELRDLDDDISIEDRLAMLRGKDYVAAPPASLVAPGYVAVLGDEPIEDDDGTITFTDEEVDDVPTQRRKAGKGKTLFLADDGRVLDPETGREV